MPVSTQAQLASSTGGAPIPGEGKSAPATIAVFRSLLLAGLVYSFYSLRADVVHAGPVDASCLPYLLLGLALLIALGLEFVNGFHDTATAVATAGAADIYGLPVSTTQVRSSGVAGTMAANRSGLQLSTVRNLALAWVLTFPPAIALSGPLYWLFSTVF